MTKIMLVEDDKSLREIYGVRLLAEGYDIVSAADGEEALAMAIKERPKLIISDVMMPKISGFDMLDILRSTTETKNIKVIMMTALSSEDQRQRGEQLGADRYLVKSQVGIEDVIRVVHEVLGDQAQSAVPVPASVPTPPVVQAPVIPSPSPRPAVVQPAPALNRPAAPTPPLAPRPVALPVQPQATPYTPAPATPSTPAYKPAPMPTPTAPSVKNRVIQPINNPTTSKVNINELLDRELAREAGIDVDSRPQVNTTAQEKTMVGNQLNQFTPPPQTPAAPQVTSSNGTPTIQIDADGHVSMPPAQSNQPPVPPSTTPPPATPPTQPV